MSPARRGLSLLEVLIVVTLIATMMALSLPMLSSANAKARSELCRQNLVEIGQTVAIFTQDMDCLPTLHPLEPTQDGQSLPKFIEPRLHTPYVVFCPSDETDESQVLGTSYRWNRGFNGLKLGELGAMLGQPMLTDREAYHTGPDLPINEVVLDEDDFGYRLTLLGGPEQGAYADGHGPTLYLDDKPKEQPKDRSNNRGNGHRRHHDDGRNRGNSRHHSPRH